MFCPLGSDTEQHFDVKAGNHGFGNPRCFRCKIEICDGRDAGNQNYASVWHKRTVQSNDIKMSHRWRERAWTAMDVFS
jgi:hypothetical protein